MLHLIGTSIGALCVLLGLAGSILPVLPGPPLSFIGLFLLAVLNKFSPPLTSTVIIVMAAVTLSVTVLDYVIPVLGAKRYGTSKWGIGGSVVGVVAGLFYPPFGIIIGAFVGAVVGEWLARGRKLALKAGWGTFVGILSGMVLKMAVSAVIAYYFVRALL